jgi:hypothetical protein
VTAQYARCGDCGWVCENHTDTLRQDAHAWECGRRHAMPASLTTTNCLGFPSRPTTARATDQGANGVNAVDET